MIRQSYRIGTLLAIAPAFGLLVSTFVLAESVTQSASENQVYATVLSNYVDDRGMVDYRGLKANCADLDRFVGFMADLDPNTYRGWSEPEKIAFWINAYNALTLQTIIDHYPIKKGGVISGLRFPENSIRQIPGVWDSIAHTVMGKSMTLEHIEHEILRKQFDEPRIHMALVCAAMGCPPLRNEPFSGDRLDEQLDDQSRKFLATPSKFRLNSEGGTVYLSSIFNWFGQDFVSKYGRKNRGANPIEAVLIFASKYVDQSSAARLVAGNLKVKYLDYDWSLNEQR